LVTYGDDRNKALSTMCDALDNYVIRGVTNNIPLLRDIVTEKKFVAGDITTNYLPEVYPDGFKGKVLSNDEKHQLVALSAIVYAKQILISRTFQNSSGYFFCYFCFYVVYYCLFYVLNCFCFEEFSLNQTRQLLI
jgi:propionyl-CoA carboxylase alpha chain